PAVAGAAAAAADDDDALVPAAERAAWAREQSEFERALDEDNVLFDIDDAGFIFVDPSDPSDAPLPAAHAAPLPPVFRAAAARGAAAAPVRITTRVPDFSDVLAPRRGMLAAVDDADAGVDCMLDAPLLLDAACARRMHAADVAAASCRRTRTPSSSTAPHSPAITPRAVACASPPAANAAQHFVPHYSSVASPWSAGELSSGWQFISTPRDPRLHVPTLLAQQAFSLAVLRRRRAAAMDTDVDDDDGADADDGGENADGMAYCIDWSRADAIVVQPQSPPPPPAAASPSGPDAAPAVPDNAAVGPRLLHAAADAVDVIQKTMLPADVPFRTCLRCGHSTRQKQLHEDGDGAPDDGWISRFDLVCICGGSWIAS
ncbi:hypothetical protein GGI05_001208, partial [Coemansia sp. RSA 2603]